MNVALTRARSSLFVLANAHALQGNEKWGALIAQAREMNRFKDMHSLPPVLLLDAYQIFMNYR